MMRRTSLWMGLFTAATMAPALAPTRAGAQEARFFQNSWFWGVHAGSTTIGTAARASGGAATIGAEWMITRKSGGLYVAYDQANFDKLAAIEDGTALNGQRRVAIRDLRTISIGGVAFPSQLRFRGVRPYGGIGLALNLIGSAAPEEDVSTTPGVPPEPVSDDVINRTEDARSRSTVFAIGGAQWQTRRIAVFGQVMAMPSSKEFLITQPIAMITAGVRYNFGPSVER